MVRAIVQDLARSSFAAREADSRPKEIALAHARVRQFQQSLLEMIRGSRGQEIETARAKLNNMPELDQHAPWLNPLCWYYPVNPFASAVPRITRVTARAAGSLTG